MLYLINVIQGLQFDIYPSDFPEDLDKTKYLDPRDYAKVAKFIKKIIIQIFIRILVTEKYYQ